MRTINVIGCGNVGRALSRLWTRQNVLEVRSILNRSLQSGLRAVEFVGRGGAVEDCSQMEKADIVMISASDESIGACCGQLCQAGIVKEGTIVFHLSGSIPSTVLAPAKTQGAAIASVHPVKSFADPAAAAESFAGTFCAIEGDSLACEVLRDVLHGCGAITFDVDPQQKTIYHAATVIVCNYLATLMEVGLKCFQRAGIPRETAMNVIRPMVTETVGNVFELGTARALTGPIARGEPAVVQRQRDALAEWDEDIGQVYEVLGRAAVELSAAKGQASADILAEIGRILRQSL